MDKKKNSQKGDTLRKRLRYTSPEVQILQLEDICTEDVIQTSGVDGSQWGDWGEGEYS